MKKILSTMLVGALIAGAAFADVGFSYTGAAIFQGTTKAIDKVDRNDCLALTIQNEVAGVVCDWDIEGDDKLALDSFYGWMTFGLPVGNLQITSGKWRSRYVNRVNSGAGNLDAYNNYFERFKPGNIVEDALAADSDNLTEGNYSTVLAYTLADTLPGTLMVKFGLVNSSYNDPAKSASGTPDVSLKSGFVGEVCWFQENLIKANVAVKNYVKGATTLGIFVSPLMVAGLDATVGFSTAIVDSDWVKDYSEIAFDLRARYAVSEKTGITGMFNYSNAGIKDNDKTAMWTMLGIDYVAGDNIKFVAALNNTVNDFDAAICTASEFAFSTGCDIKASEKATVSVGFDANWTNSKPYSGVADISLPISVAFEL
jgi:hypothetical protein